MPGDISTDLLSLLKTFLLTWFIFKLIVLLKSILGVYSSFTDIMSELRIERSDLFLYIVPFNLLL